MFPFKNSRQSLDSSSTDEDCESLIKDLSQDTHVQLPSNSQKHRFSRFISAIATLTALALSVLAGIWIGGRGNPDRFCIAHTSNYCAWDLLSKEKFEC